MPGGLGIVVGRCRAFTRVMWSVPMVLGYVSDGFIRRCEP
jgi:hypothetical protein